MVEQSKPIIWSYQTDDDSAQSTRVTKARYPNQQDSFFVSRKAPALNEQYVAELFTRIGKKFKNNEDYLGNGTTASIASISSEGILNLGNIGDSPVNIYVFDPKTKTIVETNKVFTEHKSTGTLKNFIAVSRSFGNTELRGDYLGLTDVPDIQSVDLNKHFDRGFEVFITLDSDGSFINDHQYENINKSRMEIIEEKFNGGLDLAKEFVNLADQSGSNDNIHP
ncbi:MAG: PP2C family serine/threonine-protein phosphatase, partial [Alphaproteobacteria bacterium]